VRGSLAVGEREPADLGGPESIGQKQILATTIQENTHMLIAKQVALELVRELRPIVPMIRKFDRNLAQQLVDAVNSTVQNLSEGECHSGGNKRLKYEIALGEANEAKGSLDLAVAWGWIEEDIPARKVLGRLLAMCWGLTRAAPATRKNAKHREEQKA
jgi:four helix bundle protein